MNILVNVVNRLAVINGRMRLGPDIRLASWL